MILTLFNKSSIVSYLLALVLLGLAVYSHALDAGVRYPFDGERNLALVLLSCCMLAVDWSVKQRYWATKANYHLVFFSLFVYALPLAQWNNWTLIFFFFYWIGLNYLIGIDQSGGQIKKTFNASFFIFLGSFFYPPGFIFISAFVGHSVLSGRIAFKDIGNFFTSVTFLLAVRSYCDLLVSRKPFNERILFSTVNFELPWETPFRRNLWWILLLVVLLLSLFRHYIDMSAKSAAYGLGIYALLATALAGLTFVLFFQAQNKMSCLLIMVVTALSTRLFEIKTCVVKGVNLFADPFFCPFWKARLSVLTEQFKHRHNQLLPLLRLDKPDGLKPDLLQFHRQSRFDCFPFLHCLSSRAQYNF